MTLPYEWMYDKLKFVAQKGMGRLYILYRKWYTKR